MAKRGRKLLSKEIKKSRAVLVKFNLSEYAILSNYCIQKKTGVSTYLRESGLKNISTKNLKK